MFTGIIQAIGQITQQVPLGESAEHGLRLTIDAGLMPLNNLQVGDSVAVNGVCLTVTALTPLLFWADVSAHTLSKVVGLNRPGEVNLEPALRVGDALGGHLVSGHVDGVAQALGFTPQGESLSLRLRIPNLLAPYLATKGSVTINGVSLTVNAVSDHDTGCDIDLNLIPHTLCATTLHALVPGDEVNVEIDPIARYCERLLSFRTERV